jgi:hypothetical protein
MAPEQWEQDVLDRYERIWAFEMEAREHLTSRLQFALALLTANAGGVGYLALNTDLLRTFEPMIEWCFRLPFFASIALCGMAIFWFGRASWGHDYEALPCTSELEAHRQASIDSLSEGSPNPTRQAYEHAQAALLELYVRCGTQAALINQARYQAIHRTNGYVMASLFTALVAGLVFKLVAVATN